METQTNKTWIYCTLATTFLAIVAFLFSSPTTWRGTCFSSTTLFRNSQRSGRKGFPGGHGRDHTLDQLPVRGYAQFPDSPLISGQRPAGMDRQGLHARTPIPANILFAMMTGFFIMCLCMKMKWYTALFASVAWDSPPTSSSLSVRAISGNLSHLPTYRPPSAA